MPNHLAAESSPYLRQHADNPVDWYPWGEEAFQRARAEDKPVFLSIGYAACHWCHVMAHESFEDPETAGLLNARFVNVKVDREERPDLDGIYMQAVMNLTGQGGWPMSVWLTPEGAPFYGGTYYPPEPRHGLPAFRQILEALSQAWSERREEVLRTAGKLRSVLEPEGAVDVGSVGPDQSSVIADRLRALFDPLYGGWGGAPKFPQPMLVEFLLGVSARRDRAALRPLIDRTLMAMARGGIYDQLGGGFHRYSTDARWLVPHFEKMLYDNAQLARVYLHAWLATGAARYRRVAVETLDYVLREMTDPDGGFYSSQDADSDGEEGTFFVWSLGEVQAILGAEAEAFTEVYDVSEHGNWEGVSILHEAGAPEHVARRHGLDPAAFAERLADQRHRLWVAREARAKPGRDGKVLAAWNGLMLAALADAARGLGDGRYRAAAERNADFLLGHLMTADGRLRRTWSGDHGAKLNGYLEDYSHVIEGLLALYQATFAPRWLEAALALAETTLTRFRGDDGLWYDTSDDHETLIVRPRDLHDNAVPSGNAMWTTVLVKLAALTGDRRFGDPAERSLAAIAGRLQAYPLAFGQWLIAYDLFQAGPLELAIVGQPDAADTQTLLDVVSATHRPHLVVAAGPPDDGGHVPLLRDRPMMDGKATAYLCRAFVCQAPTTDPVALQAQLEDRHDRAPSTPRGEAGTPGAP